MACWKLNSGRHMVACSWLRRLSYRQLCANRYTGAGRKVTAHFPPLLEQRTFFGILGMRHSPSEKYFSKNMSAEIGTRTSVERVSGAEAVPDPLIGDVKTMIQILHEIDPVKAYTRWSVGCAMCRTIVLGRAGEVELTFSQYHRFHHSRLSWPFRSIIASIILVFKSWSGIFQSIRSQSIFRVVKSYILRFFSLFKDT